MITFIMYHFFPQTLVNSYFIMNKNFTHSFHNIILSYCVPDTRYKSELDKTGARVLPGEPVPPPADCTPSIQTRFPFLTVYLLSGANFSCVEYACSCSCAFADVTLSI